MTLLPERLSYYSCASAHKAAETVGLTAGVEMDCLWSRPVCCCWPWRFITHGTVKCFSLATDTDGEVRFPCRCCDKDFSFQTQLSVHTPGSGHWTRAPDSSVVIERSRVRVPTGAAGEFSSPGSTFCADSYFGIRFIPVLPQWHVKDPGHSVKRAGG